MSSLHNTPAYTPTIEFVNHAAVLISDEQCGLLSDPWLFGDTFHLGWSLLIETPDDEISRLLEKTTHIWLSHEHPDHFSLPFFQRFIEQIRARNIEVIFQKTRDHRVAGYLKSIGIRVVELAPGKRYNLHETFSVWVEPSDIYDSALIAQLGNLRVFNVNDCPLSAPGELARFTKKYGTCDVLLTQFSYAAWNGGKDNTEQRRQMARHKLDTMHKQIEAFRPRSCVLFANFVRFANVMNSCQNDAVNHPDHVMEEQSLSPARLVIMAPGEVQPLNALEQSPDSLGFWRAKYAEIPDMALIEYPVSESVESLTALFADYQKSLLRQNNRLLMHLARKFLAFHPFLPTTVRLVDLDVSVQVDILGTFSVASDVDIPANIGLHSSSLAFCFKHPFGLDTLFVNGCFDELSSGGFSRFAKCLGIGNLNAIGVSVKFSSLWHLDAGLLLLRKLRGIQNRLKR
jgi:UDP-MurNAc hydroxylase